MLTLSDNSATDKSEFNKRGMLVKNVHEDWLIASGLFVTQWYLMVEVFPVKIDKSMLQYVCGS